MRLTIDLPDKDIPPKQGILNIDVHFVDGKVCECDYPFKQELETGHWINKQVQNRIDGEIRNAGECSECHSTYFRYDLLNTVDDIPKYCPNCGAKMESEVSE